MSKPVQINPNKVHFIGIKGVAMSGLAVIGKQLGWAVRGSDVAEEFITDKILKENNIFVYQNFAVANLDWQPDLVVIGASWGLENSEVKAVKKRKIPQITESELRGYLSRLKKCIAVAGIHGKTTTTALLAYIFSQAGLDPSFLVGTAKIKLLGGNSYWSNGEHFIVEGDEYAKSQKNKTAKFLDLEPVISIITSLEWEHVDIYKKVGDLEKAFSKLINNTKELAIVCSDWTSVRKIIKDYFDKVVTYGFYSPAQWQITDFNQFSDKTRFTVKREGQFFDSFEIKLMGRHNALNALSCIIVSLWAGIDIKVIKTALQNFSGIERRFDLREISGITFIDDYGHHPTEIAATLKAVRDKFPKKVIWCVFQSHTVSRTQALIDDFAKCFSSVDKVVVVDIFTSAREEKNDSATRQLVEAIKKHHPDVVYGGDIGRAANFLKANVKPGEVVVTMGAGDVYKIKSKIKMTIQNVKCLN